MNSTKVTYRYGKTQFIGSERMQKNPRLSKFILSVFGYTNIGNYARSVVFNRLLKEINIQAGWKVLDLGAGLGEFSFMISDAHPDIHITALEIMDDRVSVLERVIKQQEIKNIEIFPDFIQNHDSAPQFDLIFSVDVFEHIYENEMPFAECMQRLKPGGLLLVKIPNIDQKIILPNSYFGEHNDWLDDEHVGQVYDLEGLKKRFKSEGFEIVHASYSDGWFSRLAWELGYFTKKGGTLTQLLFLPLCKLFVAIDNIKKNRKTGNAIQVIGRKAV